MVVDFIVDIRHIPGIFDESILILIPTPELILQYFDRVSDQNVDV